MSNSNSNSQAANSILDFSQSQSQSQFQSQDVSMTDGTPSQGVNDTEDLLAPAPVVYLATYSNVPVFELTVRGIGVMRRRADGFLNATQILKLAGIEKGKRTKILEKEVLPGEHEKVQGGYGKYQGTWIPLRRAIELAGTYNVAHILQPLLELDPNGQVPLAGKRKRPNPNAPAASMYHRQQAAAAAAAAAAGGGGNEPPVPVTRTSTSTSIDQPKPARKPNPNYSRNDPVASGSGSLSQGFNDSQSFSFSPLYPYPSQPSQQPRFLQLKPPTDLPSSSSSSTSVQPDASIFLPPGAGKVLVSVDSNHNSGNGSIPPGTSENHLNNLINYDSFGYSPNGIPLPSPNQIKNLKRSGGGLDGEEVDELSEGREKRSKGSHDDLGEGFGESSSNIVKDLNSLGPSGGSFKSAIRPRSNVNSNVSANVNFAKVNGPDLQAQNQLDGPRFSDRPIPVRPTDEGEKKLRNSLIALFSQEDSEFTDVDGEGGSGREQTLNVDDLLKDLRETSSLGGGGTINGNSTSVPNLNLVIDDHGHTSLHWAVALSRLPLISLLVSKPPTQGGSNPNAGNYAGETPLHRAVLVTNSYESSSFPRILDLLKDSLEVRDFRKRTVLHHISLVGAQKGRAGSALYYLDCVLTFLEEKYRRTDGGESVGDGMNSKGFKDFINAQDDDGETALGNVSRIGNSLMIKLLLKFGARKDLSNHFGIKPDDWSLNNDENGNSFGQVNNTGINVAGNDDIELGISRASDTVNALIAPPKGPIGKSKDTMEKIQQTLTDLSSIFENEIKTKSSALTLTQSHLQAATRELSSRRRLVNNAHSLSAESRANHSRNLNLRQVFKRDFDLQISDGDHIEVEHFMTELKNKLNEENLDEENPSILVFEEALNKLQASNDGGMELVRSRFLKRFLENSCQSLNEKIEAVQIEMEKKEYNSRRVVAACCNVKMESVEEMLEDLAVAIESDGPDADISRVAKFLEASNQTA